MAPLETHLILGDLNHLFTTDEQHPVMDAGYPPALSQVNAAQQKSQAT